MSGSRDLTSREAVTAVEAAVVRELGWYSREPPAPDYGIDLYVEAAVDGVPNGPHARHADQRRRQLLHRDD
jgi:hypothetical protein